MHLCSARNASLNPYQYNGLEEPMLNVDIKIKPRALRSQNRRCLTAVGGVLYSSPQARTLRKLLVHPDHASVFPWFKSDVRPALGP